MPVSLTGMASGLDTESVIQQLMAIEQTKATAVQRRQVAVTQHKNDLSAIKTKLDAVKTAAADLTSATLWKPAQTTTSSDPTKIDASVTAGAGIGGHSFEVRKLASSAQHGFSFTSPATAGTLSFYYGADPLAADASKLTVPVAANATATDIATAINANDKSPVYAAVVKEGAAERLVFSSRKTGDSSNFTVDTSGLAAAGMSELTSFKREGAILNADVSFNGVAIDPPPQTNVLEAVIPGVKVSLKGITSSPVTVNTAAPAINHEEIAKKITALVDAYNAVVTATRSELTEKRVPTATTTSDVQKGQLFGDSGMNSMLTQLKSAMTKPLADLGLTSLSDLGISVPKAGANSADARAGKLTIDQDKLKATIAADYTKTREFFEVPDTERSVPQVKF